MTLRNIVTLLIALLGCMNGNTQAWAQFGGGDIGNIDDVKRATDKLYEALYLLDVRYMEDVNLKKATENAIKGMLEELDPHSVYIPADEYKKMNEPLKGNFEGVGVTFNILHDTIVIVSVVQGGPSEKVGVLPGDQIINVDAKCMAGIGIKNSDVIGKLRGPKNTEVVVGIKRRGEPKLLDFTIVRDNIPLYSIDASYMATPDVGYIKLSRFASTTSDEFNAALQKLKAENMKNLILDLNGNGGGLLDAAVNLVNEFIGDKKLIVYTEGKHAPRREYRAEKGGDFRDGKVIILIDEGSASASEIVAGAVQDWDRGLLVGRRTFGKGLVQRPFMLPDSSYLRLTVAHYYTPSGRSIQKPYDEGRDTYQKDIGERLKKGELTDSTTTTTELPDSLKFFTRSKKRPVYGGGGVTPDIFVALDTTQQSSYWKDINRKGLLNKFALEYVNQHRDPMHLQYANVDSYDQQFIITDTLLSHLYAMTDKEGITRSDSDIITSKNLITISLKAIIARYLWDATAYYKIANQINPSYQKALETMKNGTLFSKIE
ncbi:MAG: S41 family peptidase [Chitinophagales bacterium]|nr:S41 family peptidase [Chitinophagales bacterium]